MLDTTPPSLTAAEAERLAMLAEEAGEVVAAAADIVAKNMAGQSTDHVALEAECADLLAVAILMKEDLGPQTKPAGPHAYRTTRAAYGPSPAQAERLNVLQLRAAAIVQAACKTLRHGFESYHPNNPYQDNRELLALAVADFAAAVEGLEEGFLPGRAPAVDASILGKLRYTHHQPAAA